MKRILNKLFLKTGLDYLALTIVLTGMIWTNLYYKFWKDPHRIIVHDVILYYEYLPAAIIYKDLSMSFTQNDPAFFQDKIWKTMTSTGKSVSRMTMGLAVLYSPFFLAAHGLAQPLGYPADGYSYPYRIALIISSVVYAILGFVFLIKLLRKYFARSTIAITILALGLGTNLYFYTTIEPTMSHAYSFFLFAVFIYLVDAWYSKPSWLNSFLLGLVGGLIILVRIPNGIIFVIFPLWQVDSFSAFIIRLKLLIHKSLKSVLIILTVCLVFVPQILYWKYVTGEYFYNSYGDQGVFFFNDPAFIKGLFSYRKGWLIYTPVMAFSLLGIVVLYFRHRKFFWPVAVFTLLNLYIVWSWWCWWYGGGFGQRALIESYALLSIPFAAFTKFILERKLILRIVFLFLVTCFISLNIFETRQYYIGVIHWDAMSKSTYWDSFFRLKIAPNFYNHIENPDYDAALKGDR
jgi:hypothetical protein